MITREQAEVIVRDYLTAGHEEFIAVDVRSYRETFCSGAFQYVHNARHIEKLNTWYAYIERPNPRLAFRDSWVILVSKETGEILYNGSACDEG